MDKRNGLKNAKENCVLTDAKNGKKKLDGMMTSNMMRERNRERGESKRGREEERDVRGLRKRFFLLKNKVVKSLNC